MVQFYAARDQATSASQGRSNASPTAEELSEREGRVPPAFHPQATGEY
jgi:hypothetical protein